MCLYKAFQRKLNIRDVHNPGKRENMKTIIRGLTLVTLILLTACMVEAAQSPGRWELLGQREVDFKADHDQIDLGRSEGRFKQLQIRAKKIGRASCRERVWEGGGGGGGKVRAE